MTGELDELTKRVAQLELFLFGDRDAFALWDIQPTGWRILQLLLKRQDYVSREALALFLWGDNPKNDNAIAAHISRLNRVLTRELGVRVNCKMNTGYYLTPHGKTAVRNAMEREDGRKHDETDSVRCPRQPGAPWVGSPGDVVDHRELAGTNGEGELRSNRARSGDGVVRYNMVRVAKAKSDPLLERLKKSG